MENCKLPMDPLIDILARLPVKSLMRFKSVCTFFYDLIKNNHEFMHKHYEFRRGKSHCAVIDFESVNFPWPNQVFNLIYKEADSDEVVCIYLDMPNSKTRYVKCCHGMLCLILGRGDLDERDIINITSADMIFDVLILNPSTREIKALPCIKVPDKPPNKQHLHIEFGFGLSNNMTWKIIMLLSFEDANWEIEDSHGIVMVCSQVGDLWSWRQIDATQYAPYFRSLFHTRDFYLKGKYYWQSLEGHLVWFDMDDEVFGKIELPSKIRNLDFFTVMNESIAVVTVPQPCTRNEFCTEIWVMDENNNNINWHKQTSIHSSADILDYFTPIGFWNPSDHLLVFSGYLELRHTNYSGNDLFDDDEFFFKDGFGPNLISIDLVTQERKIIFTSQEMKSTLNIVLNPVGYVQVCSERSINDTQEWNDSNIAWNMGAYLRVFDESLKLL